MIDRATMFHSLRNGGLPRREVELPDGNTIYVRRMTVAEQNKMYSLPLEQRHAWIVMTCACLEDGSPFFSADDLPAIEQLPAYMCDPIWIEAQSARVEEDDEDEEAAKNGEASVTSS